MHTQEVIRALDSLALTQLAPERQVARLRELAADAYVLAEIMHVPEARQTLADAAGVYAGIADRLERARHRVAHSH